MYSQNLEISESFFTWYLFSSYARKSYKQGNISDLRLAPLIVGEKEKKPIIIEKAASFTFYIKAGTKTNKKINRFLFFITQFLLTLLTSLPRYIHTNEPINFLL